MQRTELRGLDSFVHAHPGYEPVLVSLIDQTLPGVRTLPVREVLSLRRGGAGRLP